MLTVFQCVTMENWVPILYAVSGIKHLFPRVPEFCFCYNIKLAQHIFLMMEKKVPENEAH